MRNGHCLVFAVSQPVSTSPACPSPAQPSRVKLAQPSQQLSRASLASPVQPSKAPALLRSEPRSLTRHPGSALVALRTTRSHHPAQRQRRVDWFHLAAAAAQIGSAQHGRQAGRGLYGLQDSSSPTRHPGSSHTFHATRCHHTDQRRTNCCLTRHRHHRARHVGNKAQQYQPSSSQPTGWTLHQSCSAYSKSNTTNRSANNRNAH